MTLTTADGGKVIFSPLSPFHLFMAEQLIRSEFLSCGCHLILEGGGLLRPNRDLWDNVLELRPVGHYYTGRRLREASDKNLAEIKCFVNDLMVCSPLLIVLVDIHHPLHNLIYFDREISRHASFALLADGIGSYTRFRRGWRTYLGDVIRWIRGLTGAGVKFRPYVGSYYGEDRNGVSAVYGFCAEHLTCEPSRRRNVQLPFHEQWAPQDQTRELCLFLGQPLGKFLPRRRDRIKVCRGAIDQLLERNFRDYAYKPHRAEAPEDSQMFVEAGFSLDLMDGRCLEEGLARVPADLLASFGSSALFNMRCISDGQQECLAFLRDVTAVAPRRFHKQLGDLRRLFESVGVKVL